MRVEPLIRRRAALALAASASLTSMPLAAQSAASSSMKVSWGPFKDLTTEEMEALGESSKAADAGVMLPSGVRVIDLVAGTGPEPLIGDRVYCHYKVWSKGFRSGPAADISFTDNRPYDWILGEPTARLPAGADEGVLGMREGGWRRLVVPGSLSFASGLRKGKRGIGGEWSSGPKAPYVLEPYAETYWDLIMFDGGSKRCEALLRPPGVSERDARKLKSLSCSARMEIY